MTSAWKTLTDHAHIIWALMFRELATRYGRNNIGFLWVLGEPMTFCIGVLILYRSMYGPYERGYDILPFIISGYMPTILVRHIVMYSVNAVKINNSLLYHKTITILDLYTARIVLEFIGVTLGAFIIYAVMLFFGLAKLPFDLGLMYLGWFATALSGTGMALIVGAISEIFEVVERIIGVTLYILVPLSGTFFIADWIPESVRHFALLLPFLNCSEMIRAGLFGPAVPTHYDIGYTYACGAAMTVIGLLLVRQVRDRVEVY